MRNREHARGHLVVAREDRSRPLRRRHLQQLARALDTRVIGVVALRDQLPVERQPAVAQAVAITLEAMRHQARKRVTLVFRAEKTRSWDHGKLGGSY